MEQESDYVEYLTQHLPEMSRVRDLIRVGLYVSAQAAYSARSKGLGPVYMHIPQRGIVYEKQSVIDFVKNLKKKDGIPEMLERSVGMLARLRQKNVPLRNWSGHTFKIPDGEKIVKLMREGNRLLVVTDVTVHTMLHCNKCKEIKDHQYFSAHTSPCNQCHSDILKAFYEKKNETKEPKKKGLRWSKVYTVPLPPGGNDVLVTGEVGCPYWGDSYP